ncbi:energy-coupling factor transport system substrate-specific component [Dethiosulfatibacter aminovorans DSM 17477]|uniref:Energy-coupling factor transport system substrate-specific component n=1 Tax=Dethiosulfatibacter aminovorans DSM 17477 TaxID=1121476 RepID=A0A1M6BPA0_9FIRM|nr:ECF transporter S component [Dethiosulfatibacter aminovorans]SHI50378.1 energy-coupling factor transport system substrate-specific component [Dethiosulfatibacter aminovorans DSM 17477]
MKRFSAYIVLMTSAVAMLALSIIPDSPFSGINWALLSVCIVGIAILMFFVSFEKKKVDPKEMALIATMASIAGISRVPFAIIMSLQPTTFIIMITGYVFGSQTGFVTGAVAALVSNFFVGQGPWTPWQMFCWGLCGIIAGQLGRKSKEFNVKVFAAVAFCCGFMYGWIMNIWHWVGFVYPLTVKTFIATYIASIPFDSLHAMGNVFFTLVFGKSFFLILTRFKRRLTVDRP